MQQINMDNINLDDYYVSIEYLDNIPNNDIDNWIESGDKEKIIKKLSKIYKNGRSFTSNQYQVTSTDPVFTPFLYQQNNKWVIEYAEARHIYFFPALYDVIVKNSVPQRIQDDNENDQINSIVPKAEKTNKKRKLPEEINKEPLKNENKSPEKKKRKCNLENNSNVVVEINEEEVKLEKKLPEKKIKSNNTIDLDNHSNVIKEKNNEAVKGEKKSPKTKKFKCNNGIDLDNHSNAAEISDSKKNIIFQTPEIPKHKKKSKEKKSIKSDSEIGSDKTLNTPTHHQTNDSANHTSDLNGELKTKHKKKSKKSVNGEINETNSLQHAEPVKINVISNGNDLKENREKKKKKTSIVSNEVKQEKIDEESSVNNVILPKLDVSEDVKKQKKHKKRKHSGEEIMEVKKEKIHKKSKKQSIIDN